MGGEERLSGGEAFRLETSVCLRDVALSASRLLVCLAPVPVPARHPLPRPVRPYSTLSAAASWCAFGGEALDVEEEDEEDEEACAIQIRNYSTRAYVA